MSSIFEYPNLNKIFLVYGNLDDMFLSPDLQKNNFRMFLNNHLRSLGYEQIVFYSGAKNIGKYVLDDESAMHAINRNRMSPLQSGGKRRRRILHPRERTGLERRKEEESGQKEGQKKQKLIYRQPKITPAEFLDDAKNLMASSKLKTAIVFPFFQNFVTDASAPMQQYSELLSHLWDEFSLSRNENICIFLAPQMDKESIAHLFDRLHAGEIFRERFFNDDETMNENCSLYIGLPNRDELRYMLEYLRIVGHEGKTLSYRQEEIPRIVSSLMYLSREADREENRAGYLSSVYENIVWHMKRREESVLPFSEESVKKIYRRFRTDASSDPMQTLRGTRGWEAVAKRVSEIAADHRQRQKSFLDEHPQAEGEKKRICANERIDMPTDDSGFQSRIPHFVIKGNPGVGKTTAARLIGQIFYEAGILKKGHTVEVTRDDLIDRYVGGTTGKTKECIRRAEEGVLFIDDAYSLLESGEENNYPKQALDELVAAMTNPKQHRFCLIMAGYPDPMDRLLKMNSGLSSRFGQANILTIEDYPPSLLQSIFESDCRKEGYRFWGESKAEAEDETQRPDLETFFKNLYAQRNRAHFGNARDVLTIAREAKMQSSLRDESAKCIKKEDFGDYQKYFVRHGASSVEEVYAEIDRYVGFDFIRELFENLYLEIQDQQDCLRRGVTPESFPEHYIFAGNPGTGKTTAGKMIGRFYHLMGALGGQETIFADASELIGAHVGDSKNRTLAKIQEAIDHNALLYIDEAYQIADSGYSSEIIGAMMSRMTENAADFKMVFGMYANRVEDFLQLNAGLSRRVRIVEFPDYEPKQLIEIFERTLKEQGRRITEEALEQVRLLLEYKYEIRTESFGNAGEVKRLVTDMKKRLLKRVSKAAGEADRYQYIAEDIPPQELEQIRDRLNPRGLEEIMEELGRQIGLSSLKDIVLRKQEEILYGKKTGRTLEDIHPGYYFFVGNPGTGKSTSAKLFGECLREMGIVRTGNFFSCTAKDLIGQYVGETDKKTYALLKKSVHGVLFIDEAYSLSYAESTHTDAGYKKEALEQIIAFMDEPEHRSKCCLIFAGYPKDMQGLYRSNPGMRSRIEEVYFEDYTAQEMYEIFALFCSKKGYRISEGVKEHYLPIFEKMTKMQYYANGRTARTVYEKTASNLMRRVVYSENISEEDRMTIRKEDLLSEEDCLRIVSAE